MNLKIWIWAELALLFGMMPLILVSALPAIFILAIALSAIMYCFFIGYKQGLISKKQLLKYRWHDFTGPIFFRLLVFYGLSTCLMVVILPENLFKVVLDNPLLWIAISFFYVVFSVYPQEFIYRHFFFARYKALFSNPKLFIFVNAVLFSFAHLMFFNILVFVLTFIGGIIFALTYSKTRSLMLVSIEHSLYGLWLFTLGMGDMLAFPGG